MTEDEAKGLRPGDMVLIAIAVKEVQQLTHTVLIRTKAPSGQCFAFSPEEIHGVLPRPLEVGDRVQFPNVEAQQVAGEIIATCPGHAWVKWPGDDHPCTYATSELERVQ